MPGTVTGPLTAAWLRRPLIPTGTACIQLRFDKSHSVEAVAAALQRTVNTHEALRSRLLHRVDGTADVAVLAPGPAVAVVKAAQAGDLGEIGAFVEDAASHGDGQCTPTIVCCGDHAELLLYMPHMFVDGTALAMLTDEVVDRVCGITPTPVRSASVALSEWYSHRSSGTPDQLQDANNRWTAFATADAALVAATDGHRLRGHVCRFEFTFPDDSGGVAGLVAVAAKAVSATLGIRVVPTSVLSAAHAVERPRDVIVNMLDAVPLLSVVGGDVRQQRNEIAGELDAAARNTALDRTRDAYASLDGLNSGVTAIYRCLARCACSRCSGRRICLTACRAAFPGPRRTAAHTRGSSSRYESVQPPR